MRERDAADPGGGCRRAGLASVAGRGARMKHEFAPICLIRLRALHKSS